MRADGKPEANRVLHRALELYERLAADAPGVPQFRQELALTLFSLADGLVAAGRIDEAEPLLIRALELYESLASRSPAAPSIRKSMAMTLERLAEVLQATDRSPEALVHARRARDVLETLPAEETDVRLEVARDEIRLGLLGDPAEAERHHRGAIQIYESLAGSLPDRPDLRAALAMARFHLGSLLAARGSFKEALGPLRQAVESQREARRLSPHDASIRQGLRAQRETLSSVLIRLGMHAEAASICEDVLREAEGGPPAGTWVATCLTSCAALAGQDEALARQDREAAARSYARRALDLLRKEAQPGGDPTAPHHLAWFLASCPVAEFRSPAEAIRISQAILARVPDSWVAWATLGAAHYRAGDFADAVDALERAAELNHGEILYYGFILAMAHHQIDLKDLARGGFDRTDRWLQTMPWNEAAQRLRAEAAELIKARGRSSPTPAEWWGVLQLVR